MHGVRATWASAAAESKRAIPLLKLREASVNSLLILGRLKLVVEEGRGPPKKRRTREFTDEEENA